jgi:hypothetical protein
MQRRQLYRQRLRTRCVATLRQLTQELLVLRSTREIPAPTQQQRLRDRLLETPMALFTIAVLMAARRVGRFALDAVVIEQPLIPRRELLRLAVRVDRQRQPIRAMMRRRPAQFPKRVLHPGAQVREILREAHHHVFPVRIRQHEMIQQMIEPLAGDGHLQTAHVREIRCPQSPRLMHLGKVDLLGGPMLRLPPPHAPLQGPTHRRRILLRVGALQPTQQRHRLQTGLAPQLLLQLRPNCGEGIFPRAPVVGLPCLAGQLTDVAVLPCTLAIHVRFHRCFGQRRSLMQPFPQFLHLCIADTTYRPHSATPFAWKLPSFYRPFATRPVRLFSGER